jgi:hypothetical protein
MKAEIPAALFGLDTAGVQLARCRKTKDRG